MVLFLVPSACPPRPRSPGRDGAPVSLPPDPCPGRPQAQAWSVPWPLSSGLSSGSCFPPSRVASFPPLPPSVPHGCLGVMWSPGRGRSLLFKLSLALGPFSHGGPSSRRGSERTGDRTVSSWPTGTGSRQEALGESAGGVPGGPRGEGGAWGGPPLSPPLGLDFSGPGSDPSPPEQLLDEESPGTGRRPAQGQ